MTQPAQEKQPKQSTTNASPAASSLDSIGGRKFTLTIGASLLYTILLAWGLISEQTYMSLQMVTVGAFIAGNTVSHFAGK